MRKVFNNGEWTAARFNSFVKSALRSASQRWPPKYKALKKASVGKKINWKTNRIAQHFKCASCNKEFPQKEVQIDHISPIINPKTGFTSWDDVIDNMFCEEDNLQVLCITCHKEKSTAEKADRKKEKNNNG